MYRRSLSSHFLIFISFLFFGLSTAYSQDQNKVQLFDSIKKTPKTIALLSNKPLSTDPARQHLEKRVRTVLINANKLQGIEVLSFNLFDDVSVLVKMKNSKLNKSGRTIWRGEIIQKSELGVNVAINGSVTLILDGNKVSGTVRFEGRLYEINNRVGEYHLIREVNVEKFPSDHPKHWKNKTAPSVDSEKNANAISSRNTLAPLATDNVTRVMVLYTPAVSASVTDINALVDLAIDETNQSFVNSALSGTMQVDVTSSFEVAYTETDYVQMMNHLASSSDGVLDDIHVRRYQEEADLVVMLVAQNDYCGMGNINAYYDNAFAVVNYNCAAGNYSFAHEIGHLAGARHNIEKDSSTVPYPYAHGYQSPSRSFRTIMSYDCESTSCPRVDYWSNPNKIYSNNEDMGVIDLSDNIRLWEQVKDRISNLHESYIPPNTDRELWFFNIANYVYTSPVVDENDVVYFAGRDNKIYALNSDMSIKWSKSTVQGITSSLVIQNNNLFYRTSGAGNREYGALNKEDGLTLWTHVITGNGDSPVVTEDGSSYLVDGTTLHSFANDGTKIKSAYLGSASYATPAIDESGNVIVATNDGRLRSFSPNLGLVWSTQLPSSYSRTCLAIGLEGQIYAPTVDGMLYALNKDGNIDWNYNVDSNNFDRCASVDLNHNIIIGGAGGKVLAISKQGQLLWESAPLDGNITSTPAIADNGTILIGSRNRLNALTENGEFLWSSSVQLVNQSSVAIANNGVAYIGDALLNNGGLRAINVGNLKLAQTSWPRRNAGMSGASRFERPENHAPQVTINSPLNGAELQTSDGPIALQASATDFEEGDISSQVNWTSDLDGTLVSPASLSGGVHTLTASIVDSLGLVGSDNILVTVQEGAAPTVNWISPAHNSTTSEDLNPIAFSVNATDEVDGDISADIIFSSNIDGEITSPATLSVGEHQITATVSNSNGVASSETISLTISAHVNASPEVFILSPENDSEVFEDNNPIVFSVSANDAEDGDISNAVTLSSNIDGVIGLNATLSAGQHTITASVTDGNGATATTSMTLNVIAHVNVAPSIQILSPTNNSNISEDNNPIAFSLSASDPEDGDITSTVVLTSSLDGAVNNSAQLSVGQHVITATVTDSHNASTSTSINLTIEPHVNVPPSIQINSPRHNSNVSEDDNPIVFDVIASDAEDGDLTDSIVLTSDKDGTIVSPAALSVGNHLITAAVTDSSGERVTSTINITVNAHVNVSPVVSIVSPTNNYQHNILEGSLNFSVIANDQEEGDLSSSISLTSSVDGAIQSPATLSIGVHTISASVTDSHGATGQDSITIEVFQPAIETEFTMTERFDDLPDESKGWAYYQSNATLGQIKVVNGKMQMDVSQNGNYNLNEAIVTVDLEGFENITLKFDQSDYGDELHAIPSKFTGHYSGDGVAISNDGITWYSAIDSSTLETTSSGKSYTVNIDSVIETIQQNHDSSFKANQTFQIKFQQYDNYKNPTDGRGWDNIELTAQKIFLNITDAAGVKLELQESEIGDSVCHSFNLVNQSNNSINWSSQSDHPLLILTGDSGNLAVNAATSMNACWDTSTFVVGNSYHANIVVQDSTHGITIHRAITIEVESPLPGLPYHYDFSSGLPANNSNWSFYSSDSTKGRIAVVNGNLRMDVSSNGNFVVNEAILSLNLKDESNVKLNFYQHETGDENHVMPKTFTEHHNSDGVSVSIDGTTWYLIVPTNSLDVGKSGKTYTIDLDAEIARIKADYNSQFGFTDNFMIKFQQYDNYANPSDGREWNNISITH